MDSGSSATSGNDSGVAEMITYELSGDEQGGSREQKDRRQARGNEKPCTVRANTGGRKQQVGEVDGKLERMHPLEEVFFQPWRLRHVENTRDGRYTLIETHKCLALELHPRLLPVPSAGGNLSEEPPEEFHLWFVSARREPNACGQD
eukprot:460836-Prymnesium_polylepis.1